MFKTTLTISTAVALLTIGSMADNNHRGHGKGSENAQHQERQHHKGQSKKHNEESNEREKKVESPQPTLTDAQKTALTFMVEEEKVARDVYNHLAEKWGERVFSKIFKSEQKHMDAIEKLLKRYELTVPSTMDEEGIFMDEKLQSMYDTLIEQGDQSLKDALNVAVEIEETDINDLETILEDELPADMERVYNHLLRGSYNHLRAFNRQLSK